MNTTHTKHPLEPHIEEDPVTEYSLEDDLVLHRDRMKALKEEEAIQALERIEEGNIFGGLE